MSFQVILVFGILLFILIALYRELFNPVLVFLISVLVLGSAGILSPREILEGFANEQLAVIILLLLMGDILRKTRIIEIIFDRIFRTDLSYRGFAGRMMGLVALFSAFLNNTPLVAVMMPYVHSWSRKKGISPSKLLIPLSYAAILGGCATLIGTSTNLIVNSLWTDQTVVPAGSGLALFDFGAVGGVMAIVGFGYMLLFGHRLLPDRKDILTQFQNHPREYILEAQIREGSVLAGKTAEEAGFSGSSGKAYALLDIVRNGFRIFPVEPDTEFLEGDLLRFTGDREGFAAMAGEKNGLVIPEVRRYTGREHMAVVEVVISHNSVLINKTVREMNFSSKYDASVIAVHRNGESITDRIKELKLKAGDVLLLLAGPDLEHRSTETQDFYFISRLKDYHNYKPYKIAVILGGIAGSIALAALNIFPLFLSLSILLVVLILMGIATPRDIFRGIDYRLYLIIALALALGKGMINTGAAGMIASGVITLFSPLGEFGLLLGIYFITALLAAYITNKAAVAVIFPIALTTAVNLGLDPIPFVLTVSFAAAANFMTPIGYQTNLMVYGPGGYTFRDFFRIGAPLTVIYMVVTTVILRLIYL